MHWTQIYLNKYAFRYAQYGDVSPKVDVYAFGVVIYELISAKEAIVKQNESAADSRGLVGLVSPQFIANVCPLLYIICSFLLIVHSSKKFLANQTHPKPWKSLSTLDLETITPSTQS